MAKMSEQMTYDERARAILRLHDEGMSRKEIAAQLGYKLSYLSPRIKDALANREYLSQKIDLDGLQVRTTNALKSQGIDTNEDLAMAIREGRIFPDNGWKNFGKKCVEDIARFAKDVLGIEDAPKMLRLEFAVSEDAKTIALRLEDMAKKIRSGEIRAVYFSVENDFAEYDDGFQIMRCPTPVKTFRIVVNTEP